MPALKAPSLSTRLPPIPAFMIATLGPPGCPTARRMSWSGHRLFVFGVDRVPSVIESPNVTTPPTDADASTSTLERTNQLCVVATVGSAGAPTWFPVSDT